MDDREMGGEPACWAHLFEEPDRETPDDVAPTDDAGHESSGTPGPLPPR